MSVVTSFEQQKNYPHQATNWGLQDHFGSVYVINLEHAEQRRIQITEALESIGIYKNDFEFFTGLDGRKDLDESIWKKMHMNWAKIDTSTPEGLAKLHRQFQGEAGCYMSHYRLIQRVSKAFDEAETELQKAKLANDEIKIDEAKKKVKKYSSVLILEDDTGFGIVQKDSTSVTLEKTDEIFKEAMKELPVHWDMLYFNALVRHPSIEESTHLVRLTGGDYLNAYAVHHRMYKVLLEALQPIETLEVTQIAPVDTTIHRLHPRHFCYCVTPSIAFQTGGVSYITSSEKKLNQKQADAQGLIKIKL
jgi:GR25 family glycosyltransferase involved in LPS biosynthesis